MKDISAATEQGNTVQQGTEVEVGQPVQGTENDLGQPTNNEPTQGEPVSGQEPSAELTPEVFAALQKDYKSLQTEFAKRNDSDKSLQEKFTPFGGVDKVHEYINYLQSNPRFSEFLVSEQQRELVGGVDVAGMDDEQREALNLVQKMVSQGNEQAAKQLYDDKIAPLEKAYKERLMDENFSQLDKNHTNWREMQTVMEEIGAKLPQQVQDNPQYGDLEDLYFKALRTSGKFDEYAANHYKQQLEAKQANSSAAPPTTSGQAQEKSASSMKEAFKRAKQTSGISGEVRLK